MKVPGRNSIQVSEKQLAESLHIYKVLRTKFFRKRTKNGSKATQILILGADAKSKPNYGRHDV